MIKPPLIPANTVDTLPLVDLLYTLQYRIAFFHK